jgi:hypothetical protein
MRPLIAGKWKMHGLASRLGEIEAVAASMKATPPSSDVLICLSANCHILKTDIRAARSNIQAKHHMTRLDPFRLVRHSR